MNSNDEGQSFAFLTDDVNLNGAPQGEGNWVQGGEQNVNLNINKTILENKICFIKFQANMRVVTIFNAHSA